MAYCRRWTRRVMPKHTYPLEGTLVKYAVKFLLVCAALVGLSTTTMAEKGPEKPMDRAGQQTDLEAAKAVLVEGLKLIKDGKFDEWISDYCAKTYCTTKQAKKSIKHYNLTAMKRIVGKCLGTDNVLNVTKVKDKKDGSKKIFVQCHPQGMPKPFHMVKTDAGWRFNKI